MNEKIVIKNGDIVATIETLGAQLRSLKKGDKEYIWCGDPAFWKDSCPVLFPVAGGLKEDKYILDGKEYYQRKHGFAKKQEFSVFDKKESVQKFEEWVSKLFQSKSSLMFTENLFPIVNDAWH
ncbi:MAG: hypothetical protein MJ066_05260, partial [Clostridia bacterium]|nr:hypothetical protein [Clostridia bacterium]